MSSRKRRNRPGISPVAGIAPSLGIRDPRIRSNAEGLQSDLTLDAPLLQSKRGRISIDLDETVLKIDSAGRLTLSDAARSALGL